MRVLAPLIFLNRQKGYSWKGDIAFFTSFGLLVSMVTKPKSSSSTRPIIYLKWNSLVLSCYSFKLSIGYLMDVASYKLLFLGYYIFNLFYFYSSSCFASLSVTLKSWLGSWSLNSIFLKSLWKVLIIFSFKTL